MAAVTTDSNLNNLDVSGILRMRSCKLRKPYSDGAIDDQSLIFNRAFRISYSDDNYDNNCENRSKPSKIETELVIINMMFCLAATFFN